MKRPEYAPALIGYRTDVGRIAIALYATAVRMEPTDALTFRIRFKPVIELYSLSFN